jgi:hypothetical protein
MVTLDDDRSAVLIIRVWLDRGSGQFRGRLTAADTSVGAARGGEAALAVVSSPREVTDAVSEWLRGFVRDTTKRIDTD